MATVTLTLTDTAAGGVAIHTDFKPAVGAPCTPAQSTALELINRTRHVWGIDNTKPGGGIDIDAVHRPRGKAETENAVRSHPV